MLHPPRGSVTIKGKERVCVQGWIKGPILTHGEGDVVSRLWRGKNGGRFDRRRVVVCEGKVALSVRSLSSTYPKAEGRFPNSSYSVGVVPSICHYRDTTVNESDSSVSGLHIIGTRFKCHFPSGTSERPDWGWIEEVTPVRKSRRNDNRCQRSLLSKRESTDLTSKDHLSYLLRFQSYLSRNVTEPLVCLPHLRVESGHRNPFDEGSNTAV